MALETAKQSLLSPIGFRFEVKNLPNFNPNIQEVDLPSMELISLSSPTPFSNINIPGDKINFGTLGIRFLVDEDMSTWEDLYSWIYGLGFPDNFQQYKDLVASSEDIGPDKGIATDANLYILTNSYNPNFRVVFKEMFPTFLGPLRFSLTGEMQTVSSEAQFSFRSFELLRDL